MDAPPIAPMPRCKRRVTTRVWAVTRFGTVLCAAAVGWSGTVDAGTIRGTVTCPDRRDCAGAVVWVADAPGMESPTEHEAVMDQRDLTFVPHVLVVPVGTEVEFLNSDDVWHNVFSVSESKRFNLGRYSKGRSKVMAFDRPGVVELLCNVHPEMSAFVVVTETPYVARVDPGGNYVLNEVPGGTLDIAAWVEGAEVRRARVTLRGEDTLQVDFVLQH